jgi:Fe2+ or Zn2+ uptake regulation protein
MTRTTRLDEAIVRELRDLGLKATRQRVAVLRVLRRRRSHPTAAEVHRAVERTMPGVGLKTVYHVLDSLIDAGLASCVTDAGSPYRYEARTGAHDHAHCHACGRLYDIPAGTFRPNGELTGLPAGFEPERISVRVQGLCRRCHGGGGG